MSKFSGNCVWTIIIVFVKTCSLTGFGVEGKVPGDFRPSQRIPSHLDTYLGLNSSPSLQRVRSTGHNRFFRIDGQNNTSSTYELPLVTNYFSYNNAKTYSNSKGTDGGEFYQYNDQAGFTDTTSSHYNKAGGVSDAPLYIGTTSKKLQHQNDYTVGQPETLKFPEIPEESSAEGKREAPPLLANEGRTFGHYCKQVQWYNPECCHLGWKNCCGKPPIIHPPIGGWTGGKPFKPHLVKPPIFHPMLHFHGHLHHQNHHHRPHLNPGWGGKPGSCFFKPLTAIINKIKSWKSTHGNHGGWGWGGGFGGYPPSDNAGYYFHRRSDDDVNPVLVGKKRRRRSSPPNSNIKSQLQLLSGTASKTANPDVERFTRQLDIPNHQPYKPGNHIKVRQEKQDVGEVGLKGENVAQHEPLQADWRREGRNELTNGFVPPGAGRYELAGVTGRLLGSPNWSRGITSGWTTVDTTATCHFDYQCPGKQKCCSGICKFPSYTTYYK